uniref:Uncharacterized protein n=1 Tax=Arundo donax TaxID=35708 RepID=A0A0A8YIC8_ARUDO
MLKRPVLSSPSLSTMAFSWQFSMMFLYPSKPWRMSW